MKTMMKDSKFWWAVGVTILAVLSCLLGNTGGGMLLCNSLNDEVDDDDL